MNIVYSTDDNYVRHAGISILSLFDNNIEADEINVYIIDNGIKPDNRKKLNDIAKQYHRNIEYIDFEKYKSRLVLNNNEWELPISAYARLFVDEMLPNIVERVIYLDCDTIINGSLLELWNTDMKKCTIAAVQDVCYNIFREEIGSSEPYRYFCSGVILMNLTKWREDNCQKKIIDFVTERKGVVRHHDQTILNGIFGADYIVLHPKYDVLTPMFLMSYKNLKAYFQCGDDFYSKQDVKEAVKHPVIVHFTSSNIGRPWENNAHPMSGLYRQYRKQSAWKEAPKGTFKPTYDKTQRRTYWLYQHVPVAIIKMLSH